jgi:hypothetical protein
MHRAGATLRNTASIFGAGQSKLFANDPKQGRVRLDVDFPDRAIDRKPNHATSRLESPAPRLNRPNLKDGRFANLRSINPRGGESFSPQPKTYADFVAQLCRKHLKL